MIVIETPRLILRQFESGDLEDLHHILSDATTMSFWPAPFTREETQKWLERCLDSYRENGPARLAVILREGNVRIGDCGLARSEIDGRPENDLGYIIHHAFWKHGYGTEAAEACMWYGFDTLQLRRICANMPVDHIASRHVAEKLGMRLEKQFENTRNRNILTCLYVREVEPLTGGSAPQKEGRAHDD